MLRKEKGLIVWLTDEVSFMGGLKREDRRRNK